MRKTILTAAFVALTAVTAMAVPAKKGWRTVTQPDGTTITLQLVGDEFRNYFVTSDNVPVMALEGGRYCYATFTNGKAMATSTLAHEAAHRDVAEQRIASEAINSLSIESETIQAVRKAVNSRRAAKVKKAEFTGEKKGIVIRAKFSDNEFSEGDDMALYSIGSMLNTEGYNQNKAPGSVHDYFYDMSRGMFNLTFDVYGPVTLSNSCTYYGGSSQNDGLRHAGDFASEAVNLADQNYDIDWTQYDWDGDGEVDQVFIFFAGYGQATGGDVGTIWPHESTLTEMYEYGYGGVGAITLDNVTIDTYACANELYGSSGTTKMGIGTFCHEFSHCMGLPDAYDTNYGGNYGMDEWDLMDSGTYNGPYGRGWCPAAWTSYERWYAGWLEPVELRPNTEVTGMKGLTEDDSETYVIYNDNNKNEYYLLENRKQYSWDKYVPNTGLLVIHVDYDETLFNNNIVNTTGTIYISPTVYIRNSHERMTPVRNSSYTSAYYDTFPIIDGASVTDSLTDNSNPKASTWNINVSGRRLMSKPIYNIKKANNGDISFSFMPGATDAISSVESNDATEREEYYTINGIRVATVDNGNMPSLPKGMYIVRKAGESKVKVLK